MKVSPTTPQAVSAFLRKSGFTPGRRTKLHEPAHKLRNGYIVRRAVGEDGVVLVTATAAFNPGQAMRLLESYRVALESSFVSEVRKDVIAILGRKV